VPCRDGFFNSKIGGSCQRCPLHSISMKEEGLLSAGYTHCKLYDEVKFTDSAKFDIWRLSPSFICNQNSKSQLCIEVGMMGPLTTTITSMDDDKFFLTDNRRPFETLKY